MLQALTCRRGFMLMDALGGIILVASLATILAVAINRQSRAEQKLADIRAAARMAEEVATDLQTQPAPAVEKAARVDVSVTIHALDTAAISGHAWAEITVTRRDSSARLLALVPAKSLPQQGRAP